MSNFVIDVFHNVIVIAVKNDVVIYVTVCWTK